jgi:hypothetical protein
MSSSTHEVAGEYPSVAKTVKALEAIFAYRYLPIGINTEFEPKTVNEGRQSRNSRRNDGRIPSKAPG